MMDINQTAASNQAAPINQTTPVKKDIKVRYPIIGVLVIIVIAAVLFAILRPLFSSAFLSPRASLAAKAAQFNKTNQFHILYLVNFSTLSALGVNYDNTTIDVYKNGSNTKDIISVGTLLTYAIYNEHNLTVQCDQYNMLGLGQNNNSVSCSISNVSLGTKALGQRLLAKIGNIMNSSNVSISGNQDIYGRSCTIYNIKVTGSQLNSILGTLLNNSNVTVGYSSISYSQDLGLSINGIANFGICMGTDDGIPLKLNVSITSYSKLKGTNITTTLLTVVAKNVSYSVPPSIFNLPVNFAVSENATCGNQNVALTVIALNNSNSGIPITVKVPEYSYYNTNNVTGTQTVPGPITFGKYYNINVTLSKPVNYTFSIYACSNGNCQSVICKSNSNYYNYNTSGYSINYVNLPSNATLASIFANGSAHYSVLAALIDRNFNDTKMLFVNYSENTINTYSYGQSTGSSLTKSSIGFRKYYDNLSQTNNGLYETTSDYYLNSSSSYYYCYGVSKNWNCTMYSLTSPYDFMYELTGISTVYGSTDMLVSTFGLHTYNGQSCTLIEGNETYSYVGSGTQGTSFSTCISTTYNIPLNTTVISSVDNSTYTDNFNEVSIGTNLSKLTLPGSASVNKLSPPIQTIPRTVNGQMMGNAYQSAQLILGVIQYIG